ncbi:unnamed protein product, partial [Linum tenue]
MMSCFRIPSFFCRGLNGHLARFWWSQQDSEGGMRWTSWRALCRHKSIEGLGFRDLDSNNIALLAKQAWRIVQDPDSLLATTYKGSFRRIFCEIWLRLAAAEYIADFSMIPSTFDSRSWKFLWSLPV